MAIQAKQTVEGSIFFNLTLHCTMEICIQQKTFISCNPVHFWLNPGHNQWYYILSTENQRTSSAKTIISSALVHVTSRRCKNRVFQKRNQSSCFWNSQFFNSICSCKACVECQAQLSSITVSYRHSPQILKKKTVSFMLIEVADIMQFIIVCKLKQKRVKEDLLK